MPVTVTYAPLCTLPTALLPLSGPLRMFSVSAVTLPV